MPYSDRWEGRELAGVCLGCFLLACSAWTLYTTESEKIEKVLFLEKVEQLDCDAPRDPSKDGSLIYLQNCSMISPPTKIRDPVITNLTIKDAINARRNVRFYHDGTWSSDTKYAINKSNAWNISSEPLMPPNMNASNMFNLIRESVRLASYSLTEVVDLKPLYEYGNVREVSGLLPVYWPVPHCPVEYMPEHLGKTWREEGGSLIFTRNSTPAGGPYNEGDIRMRWTYVKLIDRASFLGSQISTEDDTALTGFDYHRKSVNLIQPGNEKVEDLATKLEWLADDVERHRSHILLTVAVAIFINWLGFVLVAVPVIAKFWEELEDVYASFGNKSLRPWQVLGPAVLIVAPGLTALEYFSLDLLITLFSKHHIFGITGFALMVLGVVLIIGLCVCDSTFRSWLKQDTPTTPKKREMKIMATGMRNVSGNDIVSAAIRESLL